VAFFSGCNINFTSTTGAQVDAHLYSQMDVRFEGSNLTTEVPLRLVNQALLSFESTRFSYWDPEGTSDFIAVNAGYQHLVDFSRCRMSWSGGWKWYTGGALYTESLVGMPVNIYAQNGLTALELPVWAPAVNVGDLVYSGEQLPVPHPFLPGTSLEAHNVGLLGRIKSVNGRVIVIDSLPAAYAGGNLVSISVRIPTS
jgi:hypothetical protein